MALTLGQGAQLINDVSFQSRVNAAMVRAAIAVATEPQGTLTNNAWVKRRQLSTRVLTSPQSSLGSFAAAVAADPGSALVWYAPVAVSSSTNANPTVVTTGAAHGLTSGDTVEILGHLTNTAVNGTWVVSVLTATTFSVPQPANGAGTAGTAQKQETDSNISFTVSSVFSAVAGLAPGE